MKEKNVKQSHRNIHVHIHKPILHYQNDLDGSKIFKSLIFRHIPEIPEAVEMRSVA